MPEEKYLWKDIKRASELAMALRDAAKSGSDELPKLVEEAAQRLIIQENQIGGFINRLLSQMAPAKAAVEMLRAGISREEMTACWGVPPEMAVSAEKAKNEVPRSQREI